MMVPMAPYRFVQVLGITLSFFFHHQIPMAIQIMGLLMVLVDFVAVFVRRGTRCTCYFSEARIIGGDGKSDDENENVDDGHNGNINHNE